MYKGELYFCFVFVLFGKNNNKQKNFLLFNTKINFTPLVNVKNVNGLFKQF